MSEASYNPITPAGGSELAPFTPSQPLVPVDSSWSVPQPDFMAEHNTQSAGANTFLGQPLTPGAEKEIEKFLNDASTVFSSDMAQLGFSKSLIGAAESWYRNIVFAPIPNEAVQHHYRLGDIRVPASDRPYLVSFLNRMELVGSPESFIRASLWWYSELCKRIQTGLQGGNKQTSKPAPNLGQMTEKQLQAEAQKQMQSGMTELQLRWGGEFKQRMALVHQYLSQFPDNEVEEMAQRVLPNGHLCGSDVGYISYLYEQAVGGNLPTNSSAIAAEIKALENYMKTNRRAYVKDEPAQARLRLLYEARGH